MTAAFVMIQINVSGGMTDASTIHERLHGISGVKTVHMLAGPTDAIAYVEVQDEKELMRVLGEIRSTSGVSTSDTRIVLPV